MNDQREGDFRGNFWMKKKPFPVEINKSFDFACMWLTNYQISLDTSSPMRQRSLVVSQKLF